MEEMDETVFPPHKAGLHLEHNVHKNVYDTVEQWIVDNTVGERAWCEWVNDEQKDKAISTDSIWTLQWYPETPIGFCALAAADLDVLLKAARED